MSENKTTLFEAVEASKIPENTNKYEVVMSGGREDSQTLYLIAHSDRDAHAYADEIATARGYKNVSVSDEKTLKKRREHGDKVYEFAFPKDNEAMVINAPPIDENVLPVVVLYVHPDTTEHLFAANAAELRRQADREKKRQERLAMRK
jgi:hypothetical protein